MKSRSAQNAPASPCTVIAAPGCTDGIAAAVVKAGNRSVPEKKRGVLHAVYYGSGEVQNPPHQIRLPAVPAPRAAPAHADRECKYRR